MREWRRSARMAGWLECAVLVKINHESSPWTRLGTYIGLLGARSALRDAFDVFRPGGQNGGRNARGARKSLSVNQDMVKI